MEITHVEANKGPDYEQDHAKVAGANVEYINHDRTANQSEKHGYDNVEAMFQSPARGPRNDKGHKECDNRWRRLNEVRSGTLEPKGCYDLETLLSG